MAIKTKIPLIIFLILFVISIPYTHFLYQFDCVSSIIPGWHTTINSFGYIESILKLVFLFIAIILYWKLNKITKKMPINYFLLHCILTLPSIIISKVPLVLFVNFDKQNLEKTISEINISNRITIIINTLFLIGQIIFGTYFYKIWIKQKNK